MVTKEQELIARVDRFKFQTDNFVDKVKNCDANNILSYSQHIVENYYELDREIGKKGFNFEDPLFKKLSESWHKYIDHVRIFDQECTCTKRQ